MIIDLSQASETFGKMQGDIRDAAKRGLRSAALRAVQEIVTQIITARSPSPVDRGIYRAGWRAYPTTDGANIENLEKHAAFIEYGVPNPKIGPAAMQAIAEWAVRKGLATKENAMLAAKRIAAAMRRRGIFAGGKGLGIMKEADDRLRKYIIKEEVEREIQQMSHR